MSEYVAMEYVGSEYVGSGSTARGPGEAEEPSAKDKAMESAQAGKQAVGEVAQTAVGKAQDVVGEGKTQAANLLAEARDQLRGHAGEQHRNAVGNLRSLADELQSMAQSGQPGGVASDLVRQAADRTHGVARWLDGREPEDLLEELRRFARRRPGAFLGGALLAGVLAGRLTRGVVAAHSDDGQPQPGPSRAPGGAGGDDVAQLATEPPASGAYGGPSGTSVGGDPSGAGVDPSRQPTGSGAYRGPGVRS
jgi:hypothetical protein